MVFRSWLIQCRQTLHTVGLIPRIPRQRRQFAATSSQIEGLEDRRVPAMVDLSLLGNAGVVLYGTDSGDESGAAVSNAGDVNGDGFDDFLIGAANSDGDGNAKIDAGDTYLIFGAPTLASSLNLSNLGSGGVLIRGADAYDASGFSVSNAGDVNGDGLDDLIIGAAGGDGVDGTRTNSGEAYLIFGSRTLPSTIDLSNLGTLGTCIFGADAYDGAGNSVSAAGDINGDGFADVIIGAAQADASGNLKDGSGEAYVIFGGATLPATIDLAILGSAGITIFGVDAYDQVGSSVSNAGDVNGDGIEDIILGSISGSGADNTVTGAGESYIIFGSTTLPSTIDLSTLGTAGVILYGVDVNDHSGISVSSAGDINHDGFGDVLIGANKGDGLNNIKNSSGESYVVYGGIALPSVINLAGLGNAGITIYGAAAAEFTGSSVSTAGDLNFDGYDDVIIGSGRDETLGDGRISAGFSYIIYGGAALPSIIDLGTLETAGITINGVDFGDRSGQSVAYAGDVNNDGFDDYLIGAPGADGSDNSILAAGETYLIFGNGNHHPVFTSPTAVTLPENQQVAMTVTATDADGQSVAFSITGGADQDKFTITSAGVLSFVTPPDYEVPVDFGPNNVYVLQITADDGHGGLTNQNFSITVTNVNEAPVFTSVAQLSIIERSTALGNVVAVDPDRTGQSVTYSLSGGPDRARFTISSSGALTFITAPVYATPADVGANNVYDLQVTATDSAGAASTQTISVVVQAANFNAPIFTSSPNFSIQENNTAVGTLTATDSDLPAQTITFAISGGVDRFKFALTSTGILSFVAAPDFDLPQDSGLNNVYDLQVTASDGNGGFTVQQVAVTVTDVDDAPRVVLGGPTVTFVGKRSAIAVVPAVVVSGGSTVQGGTLTISTDAVGSSKKMTDSFFFPSVSTIGTTTGIQYANNHMTYTVQLSATVTPSAIQTFLRGITFSTKQGGLKVATRQFDITLSHAGLPSSGITQKINIQKR